MQREQAIQEIRRSVDCRQFLDESKGGLYVCPYCGSGTGKNSTGALKLYETNTWTCHACGKSGDVLDLMQQVLPNVSFTEAVRMAADSLDITIDPYRPTAAADFADTRRKPVERPQNAREANPGKNPATPAETPTEAAEPANYAGYYKRCNSLMNDPRAQAYLKARGISKATADHYLIGFDPEADPAGSGYKTPRMIIPTSTGHYVARSIDPNTPKQFQKMNVKGASPAIFNQRALYAQDVREIFIVEGVFDALSIIEAGATAIALNSTSNRGKLIKQLEAQRTAATLILCMDNDEAGQKAAKELREGLQRLNISHITADICGGYKDPNEHLTANRAAFTEAVAQAVRQTAKKPDNATLYIDTIMGTEIQSFRSDKKTGFANLDAQAHGLYSGLYAVAAISSLGKTSFCLQMADQLATAGHDVLFFSLEQSRLELVSKCLARRTAEANMETLVTSLSIRRGNLPDEVQAAARAFKAETADRFSIIEGNFSCDIAFIGDYIRRYIQQNGTQPVVFVDYLQILQPEDSSRRQTTKETVDASVTALKRISRELDLTVFIICSVNRANYLTPVDFESLKESGSIEYSCDCVWGLQLQCLNDDIFNNGEKDIKKKREMVKEAKAANPRKIELVCLKNRYGIANFSAFFDYFPAHDLFKPGEAAKDFAPAPATKKAGRKL